MQITKLSSKGQVVVPKNIRARYHWNAGQKLIVIDMGDGIILKTAQPFKTTTIDQVAGKLKYTGRSVSLEEMQEAIKKGALEQTS